MEVSGGGDDDVDGGVGTSDGISVPVSVVAVVLLDGCDKYTTFKH
jgi:hypothetical protein